MVSRRRVSTALFALVLRCRGRTRANHTPQQADASRFASKSTRERATEMNVFFCWLSFSRSTHRAKLSSRFALFSLSLSFSPGLLVTLEVRMVHIATWAIFVRGK